MKPKLLIISFLIVLFSLNCATSYAQVTEEFAFTETEKADYQALIERIEAFEKEVLKQKIENINAQVEAGEIDEKTAQQLKIEASEIAAQNISDLTQIVDSYTLYLKRNDYPLDFSEIDLDELELDLPTQDLEGLFEVLEVLGNVFEDLQLSDHEEYAALKAKRKEVQAKREELLEAREEMKAMRQKQYEERKYKITTAPTPPTPPNPEDPNSPPTPENLEQTDVSKVKGSRSTDGLVLALGFNNALTDGGSIDDSGIRFGGSRTFEIGYARESRVFKNVGWLSVKYGFSFQFNGLKPEGNNVFAVNGDQTNIEEFDFNLRKNKFRMDNLIFPLHLQLGTNGIKTNSKGARYYSDHDFKVGLGGFVGLNLLNTNKLKYTNENGQRIKERIRDDFNTTILLYGLSAYVGWDEFSFYAQYNLNPMFTDNIVDTHNIQFGVRFDLN